MAHVVLAKELANGQVGLQDVGFVEDAHLKAMSEVALGEGFDLMFEFGSAPDMAKVVEAVEAEDRGVSSMPDMRRLWVLDASKL